MENKLRIGLFGVGHLGKIHLKCILATNCWELVGFFDPNDENADEVVRNFGIRRFFSEEDLLEVVDAVDIVTPTVFHFQIAEKALRAGKHVFLEKPVTETVEEGRKLVALAGESNLKVQVGHVERFNPAFQALHNMILQPMFVESHRLSAFQPRGTDVSVILDLMIHDLDLVLHLVKSPVKHLSASGVAVLSHTPDIANVRIEFENGCVANLTASRISLKQMRKMRLFQRDHYLSLDFLEKSAQIVKLHDPQSGDLPDTDNLIALETPMGKKWLELRIPNSPAVNAIQRELETFYESIVHDREPVVPVSDGFAALELAHRILAEIDRRNSTISQD